MSTLMYENKQVATPTKLVSGEFPYYGLPRKRTDQENVLL